MKVILLIDEDSQQEAANSLCTLLSTKFAVEHVTVRSIRVPLDRVTCSNNAPRSIGGEADGDADDEADGDDALLLVNLTATNMTEASTQFPILTIKFDCSSASSALAIAKYCSLASAKTRRLVSQQIQATVQSQLAKDAQFKTQSPLYLDRIAHCYDHNKQIKATTNPTLTGKVRDTHFGATTLALVTTDRQSGFDRQLAVVPFKGAVLNLTAAFWCEATKDIIANHLISVPHPNVSIVKQCTPFPIEFVVRSYLTGSTDTSIWKHYQAGVRTYCEHDLPDGMVKNQPLPTTILTPTTKEEHHDRPIGPTAIVSEGWMTQEDLDVCHKAALAIFARGQQVASSHGLILVDTKYEFGKDKVTGEILLIDEVHTPDSSRYWLASTYQERQAAGLEPENIDKEFLRLWFRDHCDPYADAEIPDAPRDLVLELARRYITLYEMITWKDFDFDAVTNQDDIAAVIEKHLK